jgi:hypothetical protein
MEKPNKPLCLVYPEAKKEIFNAITLVINKHDLPLFLAKIIVSDALDQISIGAHKERVTAQQLYEKNIKEYEAETEVNTNG